MTDLAHVQAMIVVLAMPGCHACHDYLPRFERQVDGFMRHGVPFVIYKPGEPIARGLIPVMVLDATSQDPGIQAFANQHEAQNMPTTLLLTSRGRPVKIEGAITDQEIYNLLIAAVNANS